MKKLLLFFIIMGFGYKPIHAQYTKLLDFNGTNGQYPFGALLAQGGYLYGLTYWGGTGGDGVVFRIKSNGTHDSVLFNFSGANGSHPKSSLISDGTYLYGTASSGGTLGDGEIFKIKPDGTGFTDIFDFTSTNGANPLGDLMYDGTYMYGMTSAGGTASLGNIFKLKPDGSGFVDLYDFKGAPSSGQYAAGFLVSDGTYLYGMTQYGGAKNEGELFRIKTDGTGDTILVNFDSINGTQPYGSLMYDGTYLYGMTWAGGQYNDGVVFKVKPDGTGDSVIFNLNVINAADPYQSTLISDGTYLYGMTKYGSPYNDGALFKVKTNGTGDSALLYFSGPNGANPNGSLITDGTFLYGMTEGSGANGDGVIFKYNPYCKPITYKRTPVICAGQSITVGTHTYNASGNYIDTLEAASTCDSIINTDLTVLTPLSDSVFVTPTVCGSNNGSVTVKVSGGAGKYSFAWNNGYTTSSVTGLSGSPVDTLIVVITDSAGCMLKDTAVINCITGMPKINPAQGISIYPNPFSQITILHFSDAGKHYIEIDDVTGRKIQSIQCTGMQYQLVNDKLAKGIYLIKVFDRWRGYVGNAKIIVQ